MSSKQRTFELVDIPKTIRPMTSKQAKKAYQKANRTPRISKAEQKRRDAEELAKHRKAYEKEQAAAKAKTARDKKAAKALEQKEQRKRLGIPEPSRHVRASQSRISTFIKQGNKRLRESGNTGEDSEDTMCDDLDEKPPAKRIAHDYTEDEGETLSKPIAPDDLAYQGEPPIKNHVKKNFHDEERTLVKPIVSDDSEDEFGDFPPLSDNDISILDIGSVHSTPANATSDWPGLIGLVRSTFRKPAVSSNDKQEQELPRMKNLEREQMSPDDSLQLEDMIDSQIRSEAADAAVRTDNRAVSFEKELSYKGGTKPTTSTSNHPVKDILGERELFWHAPIHRRHNLSTQSIKSEPPVSLHQASAAKVSHDKQNINGVSLPGTCSRSVFKASAIALALPRKSLYNGSTKSTRDSVSPSDGALSRVSGSGKQVMQEGRLNSSSSRSQYVEAQHAKCSVPTCLKRQGYSPRKSLIQTSRSASDARPALQEKSTNMGPPALPRKIKPSMHFAAPIGPQLIGNSLNLPPSSTQAFLESHLDEFFPSPTQEARELCEDPIIPRSSTNLKANLANSKLHKKSGGANDSDLNDVEDDFGVMLSTQELKMFSQDWESANSPPRQEWVEKKENNSNKKIGVVSEAIENLICSQDSFFSSQEFAGLESVSKAKSPATRTSHSPQTQASKVHLTHHLSPKSQTRLTQPLNTRIAKIDPDTELTPKPRRSPWFKEKPEDKHTKKRFFTEKPEDLEAAAILDSKKAWDEIKEATSNRHNFDDDIEPEVDDQLEAALAESKEWDEVYKAVVPTPTPRKSGKKGRLWMDVGEKENQTPSRIMQRQTQTSAAKETSNENANSDSSTDYGDGEDSDWDRVLDGL